MKYTGTEMETVSGRMVDLVNTSPDTIYLPDVARHLSRIARFNGATRGEVYSVAQHSVLVADLVEKFYRITDPLVVMQALLHDAHEAYLGDITTPLKNAPGMRAALRRIESQIIDAVYTGLGVPPPWGGNVDVINQADQLALRIEARHLMYTRGEEWQDQRTIHPKAAALFRQPLTHDRAYDLFLGEFGRLELAMHRYPTACGA